MSVTSQSIQVPRAVHLSALPPLSLYVHVPWCVRKCPYCDFNSHELRGELPERDYVDALIRDLELASPSVWSRAVQTVFIGGGTPSLLSPAALDRLLSEVRARLVLAPDAEITLEANPGTVEAKRFAGFRDAGINRLSLGVQSLDARHLQALGRIHDRRQALDAIVAARASFDNINVDLMYALPGQTLEQALADVGEVLGHRPQHVSAYHLTIEPNTYFHRYPPQVPDEDAAADMQEQIEILLGSYGYRHYETSAFAQPGCQCRHNTNYWRFGDYLGIGAGAHSKISFRDRIVRQMRYKQPREYLQKVASGVPCLTDQEVETEALPFEFMMNALRLTDGVDRTMFAERTGLAIASIAAPLRRAVELGLLVDSHQRLQPTLKGQRFLNDLLSVFIAENR